MNNHSGFLLRMHPWAVKISKVLTGIYVLAAIFLLTQGQILQALFSLVLAAVFLSTIILNSLAMEVDTKIKKINAAFSLVSDLKLNNNFENKIKLTLFLFSIDVVSAQKTGKSFTSAMWSKKNQRPYSLLIDMVVDSFLVSKSLKEETQLNPEEIHIVKSNKYLLTLSLIEINAKIRQDLSSFDQLKENSIIRLTS